MKYFFALFSIELVFLDVAANWQFGFQDPATSFMQGLIDLHHDIFSIMVYILLFVMWMLARSVHKFNNNDGPVKIIHGTVIEIAWTIMPTIILMLIAIPSFSLLYATDEIVSPTVTLKAIGHQWYWSYEYSDYNEAIGGISFDSYMIQENDLQLGQLRLLEVDNRTVIPVNTNIRVIITSADVLHSWCVPSLGIKCDAVPGRLNQVVTYIKREGVFYGQCSELCGINHGFMPIVVESVSIRSYIFWVANKLVSTE